MVTACSGSAGGSATPDAPASTSGVAGAAESGSGSGGGDATPGSEPVAGSAAPVPPGLPTTVAGSALALPDDWDDFDDSLADALVGRGAWSISVAVAKDGQIVHTFADGVRDPDDSEDSAEPAEPEHRYRVASNSKVLTAIVTLQLVEAGKLTLDEAVTERIATRLGVDITEPGVADITVRQLLDHSSGFNEYQRTFFGSRVESCEEAAALGLTNGLEHPPGTQFTYSNMNYCLLGLLIADVTGKDYEDAVREQLLEPLDIDGMRLAGTQDFRDGDAHHLSGEARNYQEVLQGAGSWVGTAEDLVRIIDSLDVARDGWHPLAAESVATMLAKPDVPYPFSNRWYGLGMRVWTDGSWGHTGTVENARSMVLHRPDGITWAVMVNGDAPKNTDDLRNLVGAAFAEVGIATPD